MIPMSHPAIRFAIPILAGALLGAAWGKLSPCCGGTCPLTSTWWRGALYEGVMGLILSLSSRSA